MQYTSQVAISDIPLYLAPTLKPDIAYGSIIPSYIAIGDNFSRGTFTKGLNDFAISGCNGRPRSQITEDCCSVSISDSKV